MISEISDPLELFARWFEDAKGSEPNDYNAMSVASVDRAGLPNVRVLLLKEIIGRGFVFYTNSLSTKGDEFKENPKAAINFYWKSLNRQIRIRGDISVVGGKQADRYFASRPRASRIGAWASKQSSPLGSRQEFECAIKRFEQRFEGQDVPRPEHWHGYCLEPVEIEFWQKAEFRLHDRVVYLRTPGGDWRRQQLYP